MPIIPCYDCKLRNGSGESTTRGPIDFVGTKKKRGGEKMKNVTSGWNWGISGFTG